MLMLQLYFFGKVVVLQSFVVVFVEVFSVDCGFCMVYLWNLFVLKEVGLLIWCNWEWLGFGGVVQFRECMMCVLLMWLCGVRFLLKLVRIRQSMISSQLRLLNSVYLGCINLNCSGVFVFVCIVKNISVMWNVFQGINFIKVCRYVLDRFRG